MVAYTAHSSDFHTFIYTKATVESVLTPSACQSEYLLETRIHSKFQGIQRTCGWCKLGKCRKIEWEPKLPYLFIRKGTCLFEQILRLSWRKRNSHNLNGARYDFAFDNNKVPVRHGRFGLSRKPGPIKPVNFVPAQTMFCHRYPKKGVVWYRRKGQNSNLAQMLHHAFCVEASTVVICFSRESATES